MEISSLGRWFSGGSREQIHMHLLRLLQALVDEREK